MPHDRRSRFAGAHAIVDVSLQVIAEDEARLRAGFVGLAPSREPYLVGTGRTNLLCGGCGLVLARTVSLHQIGSMVLRCGRCGRYNEVLPHLGAGG